MYIWQTKKWWEMLLKSNQAEKIIEIDWLQIEKRKISLKQYGLFVLWIEENNLQNLKNETFEKLKNLSKEENCIFIQIETLNYNNVKENNINWFKKSYYKKFITPHTAIINLEKDEETILSEMKPKWRYNIKLAQKKWIEVKEVEKTKENVWIFFNLMKETTWRNNFFWNKQEYYFKFLKNIKNSKLLFSYFENKVIAAWIFIFDKEVSIYYYWASTSDTQYRNLMAPFLLQREAIKIAKNIWSKIYDFLWVANPSEKNSSLSWVTDFKMKLTKDMINVSWVYIYINKKLIYLFIKLLRKLK